MSQVKDDKKKQQKFRKPYRKPELLAYGTVKDLTAGGSGIGSEGATQNMKLRPQPTPQFNLSIKDGKQSGAIFPETINSLSGFIPSHRDVSDLAVHAFHVQVSAGMETITWYEIQSKNMLFYSYADLTVASTFPLIELLAAQNNPKESFPDFTLHLLDSPPGEPDQTDWIRHWRTDDEYITLSLARRVDGFLLRFPFLADFVIDAEGCRIGAWAAPDIDEETLRHLLLDQVLPRVLGYKERLVLHASAVLVNGTAMAFAGNTGAGKSTLAASFQTAGCDKLIICQ